MNRFLNAVSLFFASGFGLGVVCSSLFLGKFPLPPRWSAGGLAGTLLGLLFVKGGFPISGAQGFVACLVLTIISIWCADRAEKYWKVKDDAKIICDEIIGFIWSVMFLPLGNVTVYQFNWILACAVVLFRIFDVCKWPYPKIQNVKGGWGVVLDDLLAGLSVNLILQVGLRLL